MTKYYLLYMVTWPNTDLGHSSVIDISKSDILSKSIQKNPRIFKFFKENIKISVWQTNKNISIALYVELNDDEQLIAKLANLGVGLGVDSIEKIVTYNDLVKVFDYELFSSDINELMEHYG